jgi:hypothetical protein
MAPRVQAVTQGRDGLSVGALQAPHSYLTFFFLSGRTAAMGSSRNGSLGSSSSTSKTSAGQAFTHSPHPLHLSVSMVMK